MIIVKGVWMLPLIACTQALHEYVHDEASKTFSTQ